MKVLFRKFKEGDVIAFLPDINVGGHTVCYQHIGQHSECDYSALVPCTKLAKPEEYASLKQELESIYGETLTVVKRMVKPC